MLPTVDSFHLLVLTSYLILTIPLVLVVTAHNVFLSTLGAIAHINTQNATCTTKMMLALLFLGFCCDGEE